MKKLFLVIVLTSSFLACKKDTTTPQANTTSTTGTITAIDCGNAIVTGVIKKGESATGVSVAILYTGGDGKIYAAQTISSTGVTSLTATLTAGTFSSGNGSLIYTINGTATSAGIASFVISLGGKTCTMNVTVDDVLQTIGKPGLNITDVEGNSYKTVTIGTQQWMAENLKVTKYNDGSAIPNVTDDLQWSKLNNGAWCNYNNNDSLGNIYGKLYNWYAVDTKKLCPNGWHVPTEFEWDKLVNYLGGASVAGVKMKETGEFHWSTPNIEATNNSLFTALPNGYRDLNGKYRLIGKMTNWWSSTEDNPSGGLQYCLLPKENNVLGKGGEYKVHGISVRCIKD